MNAGKQVSPHQLLVYEVVRDASTWLTAKEIADRSQVANRTVRHHAASLSDLGLFETVKLFGGYRYRLHQSPAPSANALMMELESVRETLGPDWRP